ncbi:MAG: D-2-hydroxyacid dehydrogenase [Pseudomonadales bacterium]
MKGVILDAGSLGNDELTLDPVTALLDSWEVHQTTSQDQVAERIAAANIVLTNKVPISTSDMSQASSLELISVLATGTDNIDVAAAKTHGITVCNAVGYATPSVTQHTMALMLALSTRVIDYVKDVRAGAWQASPAFCLLHHPISELAGKELGIVGYGELGRSVGQLAEAFGMTVRVSQKVGETDNTPERVPLDELVPAVDYLTLHCPLVPRTRHLVNDDLLKRMKPTAFLINTARGGLVDSQALISALASNSIAGAAIDVLDQEPPTEEEPIIGAGLDNLIVTPHNAWGAIESRQRLISQMRENILAYLDSRPLRVIDH